LKTLTEKRVAILSFVIVGYFALLHLVNIFKVKAVVIGVFVELLTIPFLLAQIVFLFLGTRFLIKNKFQTLTLLGVLLLIISSIFTFGDFF
jgi:hypothetical protein